MPWRAIYPRCDERAGEANFYFAAVQTDNTWRGGAAAHGAEDERKCGNELVANAGLRK
jgi:hypothetical protein